MKDNQSVKAETGNPSGPPITELRCKRPTCGYRWYPRTTKLPRVCPHCKSRDWAVDPTALAPEVAATLTPLERRLLETFLEFRRVVHPLVVGASIRQMKMHIRLAGQSPSAKTGIEQQKK